MDGVTSGARHDSKRVGTKLLAVEKVRQYERRNNTKPHVPEPFTPLPNDPKRPTDPPNRVVVDASRRDLEGSVEPDREDRLTRSDDRVEVISGESERQDISYRDLRR